MLKALILWGKNSDNNVSVILNTQFLYHTVEKQPKIRIDARYGFGYYILITSCTFNYSETVYINTCYQNVLKTLNILYF